MHVITGIQGDDNELSEYQQWLIHLNQRGERLSWAISTNSESWGHSTHDFSDQILDHFGLMQEKRKKIKEIKLIEGQMTTQKL